MPGTVHDRIERRRQDAEAARQQFLQERASILGGSDIIHLMGLEPFGCQRRLCYDKLAVPADFPFEGNADTKRGSKLEEVAVREYEDLTGRPCRRRGLLRGQNAWEACHIDREQRDRLKPGPGVLEVKIPKAYNFQLLARLPELPQEYQFQLQWNLLVTGWLWGTIWVWSPDGMKGRWQDHMANGEIQEHLRRTALRFWSELEVWREQREFQAEPFDHVERLDAADRRCTLCPWRRKCQHLGEFPQEVKDDAGNLPDVPFEEDESLRDLALEYLGAKTRVKETEAEYDELAAALKLALGERQRVECSVARISLVDTAACQYTVKREAGKRLSVRGKA